MVFLQAIRSANSVMQGDQQLVWKTWKCPGIWQLSGKCQEVNQKSGNCQEKILLVKTVNLIFSGYLEILQCLESGHPGQSIEGNIMNLLCWKW